MPMFSGRFEDKTIVVTGGGSGIGLQTEKMGNEMFQSLVNAHAMKRLGEPEEMSSAILFLLSEEASFITGVALPVDGGYHLKG